MTNNKIEYIITINSYENSDFGHYGIYDRFNCKDAAMEHFYNKSNEHNLLFVDECGEDMPKDTFYKDKNYIGCIMRLPCSGGDIVLNECNMVCDIKNRSIELFVNDKDTSDDPICEINIPKGSLLDLNEYRAHFNELGEWSIKK